jgi:hypothetical protein
MFTVTVLVAVTDARKVKAAPTSVPSVALTETGEPTTAPVTVTVPESQEADRDVPVIVPVTPVKNRAPQAAVVPLVATGT